MLKKQPANPPLISAPNHPKELRIFDLRAEYALTAVKLSHLAERCNRVLALSINPDLPRYFVGNPRPLRKLFTRLVENAILAANVDVVTVQIENEGHNEQDIYRLKLSVTANGPGLSLATMRALQKPAQFSVNLADNDNSNALLVVNKQIRRLGGQLCVESQPGWGTRYVIYLQLTKFAAHQIYANAS